MAVFNLEDNQGVWFDYPSGGRVKIKVPNFHENMEIEKQTTEIKPYIHEEKGKPPKLFNQEIPDLEKRIFLFNDCRIVAWEGFQDKNGKEIPCTAEYKNKLMLLRDMTFRDFVEEKFATLTEAISIATELSEKNVLTSQSGEPVLADSDAKNVKKRIDPET